MTDWATFHDFRSSQWKTPMVSPVRGDWKRLGGAYTGTPILDETGGDIKDETPGEGHNILQDGVYTGEP